GSCANGDCGGDVCGPAGRFWVRAEYLLWWTKSINVPPLVTTSPQGTSSFNAGVLDQSSTSILLGNEGLNHDVRSGYRITVGAWLNHEQTCGIEARYFALEDSHSSFSRSSEGDPILARPFFQLDQNQQNAVLTAFPGLVRGDIHVDTSSVFYGY